jgi:hypothetical protein
MELSKKMRKILCLVIATLLMLTFTGCSNIPVDMDTEDCDPSFVIVEQELLKGYYYTIAYHKETKVMYVLGQYNDFTVMLDTEGKPLLWEGN